MKRTNFDIIMKQIKNSNILAELMSGKYACRYCSYQGEICESSYIEHSCIDGITLFFKYRNKEKSHKMTYPKYIYFS